ncbi:MAG: NAD-dependent epimerase/dehydratase family protein, partial [Lautropia mirabilis]|nr:NAD-dependent epimerase/dehydratase family protein [Lautropia mirabilis]
MENCNVCPSDTAPSTSAPIVVTGAGGFIGQHLVRQLLEAGYSVRAVTRNPATFRLSPSSPKGSEARSGQASTTPTGA